MVDWMLDPDGVEVAKHPSEPQESIFGSSGHERLSFASRVQVAAVGLT